MPHRYDPEINTTERVARELKVIEELKSKWGVSMVETGEFSTFDYFMYLDKEVRAIVEMKTRNHHSTKFPTYLIAERKIKDCIEIAEKLKKPFLLIVSWIDRTGWIKITSTRDFETGKSKYFRTDVPGETETCVYIPVNMFITL